jgi:phosphate acetyltransferase
MLLGDRSAIKEAAAQLEVSLEGIRIIDPSQSEELPNFTRRFEMLRRYKGIQEREAREAMLQPNYFGAMMVAMHQADGFVSGAKEFSGSVLRPLFQIIKVAPHADRLQLHGHGSRRQPFRRKRRHVHGRLRRHPRTQCRATLRYRHLHRPTRPPTPPEPGRASPSSPTPPKAAHPFLARPGQGRRRTRRQKSRRRLIDADFDGELQVDAALIPEIASRKLIDSNVAGRANVLIFPDLNSGNIGSKLVQHLTRANAYGQILLGLDRPAADVSRGSTAHDILGVATIVGVQAVEYHKLYPGAGEKLPGE